MKLFLIRFFLLCKRQLKNPVYSILFLGFPFFGFLLSYFETYSNSSETNTISIGLYCENPDILTQRCFDYLTASSAALDFYIADSLSSLEKQVASQKTDCGYVFPENYQELLFHQDYSKAILVYTTSSTLFSNLSNEIVFASLFRFAISDITISYIEKSPIFNSIREEAISMAKKQYSNYLEGNKKEAPTELFHLIYETLSTDNTITPAAISFSVPMPIRGIFAVLVFISALLGAINYLDDKKKKLPVLSFISISIPPFLFMLSGWFTLWITGIYTSFWKETFSSFFYLFLVIFFAQIFVFLCRSSFFLTASIPFFALGSLIFCPIFFDISSLIPIFTILEKLFLPSYYLQFF